MKLMVDGFTKQTGIKVNMRNGDDFELANQIVQEGKASPGRRVRHRELPGDDAGRRRQGLHQGRPDHARAGARRSSRRKDGDWVGFAARSTVLAYNKTQLKPAQLPASILDLAKPEWKGKIGIASAGADFQAIVSAVVAVEGEAKAAEWLKGLKANAKVYRGNNAVMQAVNNGEIQAGVIYHYYWYKDQAESGENSNNTSLHFFGNQDPGAFLSVSGAGVLATSKHQKQAQQLVKFLNGAEGQKILADSAAHGVPHRQGRRRQQGAQAAQRARAAHGRASHPQRPQGRRADAAGGPALSALPPYAGHGRGRSRAGLPPVLGVLSGLVALLALVPLLLRGRLHRQHRLGRGVGPGGASAGRRAAVQHRPARGRLRGAQRRDRHRRSLAGRAHHPARPAGLEHPARRAAGRARRSSTASAGCR